jgi:2-desacetyl-2-hydroxyethyl bacteriochlorophyllide A dehydrogenase
MKAVVISKPHQLAVRDAALPKIGHDEVLVRSRAVGICHSDYELIDGKYIIPIEYPIIPGHEWAGEVVETGKSVSSLKPGTRVVGECVINGGKDHFGFSVSGADAEYFVARPEWLHVLPAEVSFKTGSLVEPFTVGFYAIKVNGGVGPADTVVVSGGGTIGLCTAAAATAMGARTILVDPIAMRRDVARRLRVAEVIDPAQQNVLEAIRNLTNGKGADLVVEAAGHDASLAAVLDYAKEFGRISMVGINIGKKIPVELGKIQMKSLTLVGCVGSPNVWPEAIRFLAKTGLDLSPIQTHTYALAEAEAAFGFARDNGRCIKVTLMNDA